MHGQFISVTPISCFLWTGLQWQQLDQNRPYFHFQTCAPHLNWSLGNCPVFVYQYNFAALCNKLELFQKLNSCVALTNNASIHAHASCLVMHFLAFVSHAIQVQLLLSCRRMPTNRFTETHQCRCVWWPEQSDGVPCVLLCRLAGWQQQSRQPAALQAEELQTSPNLSCVCGCYDERWSAAAGCCAPPSGALGGLAVGWQNLLTLCRHSDGAGIHSTVVFAD